MGLLWAALKDSDNVVIKATMTVIRAAAMNAHSNSNSSSCDNNGGKTPVFLQMEKGQLKIMQKHVFGYNSKHSILSYILDANIRTLL